MELKTILYAIIFHMYLIKLYQGSINGIIMQTTLCSQKQQSCLSFTIHWRVCITF